MIDIMAVPQMMETQWDCSMMGIMMAKPDDGNLGGRTQ